MNTLGILSGSQIETLRTEKLPTFQALSVLFYKCALHIINSVSNLFFFRLRGYFSLLSRTELLTTLVSKSSFRKLKGDFNCGDIVDSYHTHYHHTYTYYCIFHENHPAFIILFCWHKFDMANFVQPHCPAKGGVQIIKMEI